VVRGLSDVIDLRDKGLDSGGIGIAVIGCGYWGINYLRVLRDLPEVRRLVAVDSRMDRLKEIHARFRDISLSDSADEIFDDPTIDAVVVCTPATSHYEVVDRALESGKSVLVEKPIATRTDDARAIVEKAESLGLTLAVGHTFLYNPAVRKVKTYIDERRLGQLYYIYAQRTNLGPIRDDVNALWDLATHDLSIVNYLLGRTPRWVSAVGTNVLRSGVADVGFMVLGYDDDVLAHIHVSWADPNKVRQVVVVGSERRLVFDDVKIGEQVRVYEKGVTSLAQPDGEAFGLDLLIRDGDIVSPKIELSEPLKNQCLNFIQCMKSGERPVSDGQAGLAVVEAMEAIDQSLLLRGAPIEIANGRVDLADPRTARLSLEANS
jgi:predicted dehydrogenase